MALVHRHTRDVRTWPAYTSARRRISRIQDVTGRAATLAGAALGAAGMLDPGIALPGLAAAALTTTAGLATLRALRPRGITRATASAMYATPGAGLCALLGWEAIAGGPNWLSALGLLTWVTGTWAVRPAWAARHMLAGPPPPAAVPAPAPAAELEPPAAAVVDRAARWWAEHAAVEDGPAPGTVLRHVEQHGAGIRAIIASARPGRPVPEINIAALSALLDIPEEQISISGVPGHGAGVRQLIISATTAAQQPATTTEAWRTQIAPHAAPGTELVEVRHGTGQHDGVVELHIQAPKGRTITYNLDALVSALDAEDDPSRVVVEARYSRAIITLYQRNPLLDIRAATPEDLVMDEHGYITVGRYHNGRPVRPRLYDTDTGSAQRFLMFGTTGGGKSRALQLYLAAEKRSGICAFVADLKGGQSVPEALRNVCWAVTTQEATIMMLRAAVAVAEDRMRRYAAQGRNAFELGVDPLLHVTIDEANRLLENGAPYRDEAVRLIKEIARTGRSVGVGIRLAAQASHLDELGGSDTMRGLLKTGSVTILRWASSMMRQLVADGLLPSGVQLSPIPERIGTTPLVSRFDPDADVHERGEGTYGMGYLLTGPHPASLMRHFKIGSPQPAAGLDPEILALYGPEPPVELGPEDAAAAGEAYQLRHDEPALVELFTQPTPGKIKTSAAAPAPPPAQPAAPHRPATTAAAAAPRQLADRIIAALSAAGRDLTAAEILTIVNADGGRQVALGSVRNTLSQLASNGRVVRTKHGSYTTPDNT